MKISQRGIDFIKQWEKYKSKPYDDGYGTMTIGYGHAIQEGEDWESLTEEEAYVLLLSDIAVAEGDIAKLVKVRLNQNQYDAVVSFFYNVGATKIAASTETLPDLNAGRFDEFADDLLSWRKSGGKISRGLIRRRAAERELFLS